MCGIVAIHAPGRQVHESALTAALRAIQHRGPDGQRAWLSEDGSVGLGHTRLAIIGLNDGPQPIASEDGQIQVVVNGEFYDFERIRRDLEARGHQFKTQTDSEIAVHLYEEYGLDCLRHLRGEFAIVIWDARAGKLIAVRDRFGIKPLCYAIQHRVLYVASEAKALFAAGVSAGWDAESYFHASNLQYVMPDRTLFAGVRQVRPGHYLVADADGVNTVAYWDLDYSTDQPSDDLVDEAGLIAEFRDRLSEAVRLRLRADIPVCCHLSGGLDSSAILAIAMEYSSTPLKCFSVSFEEESYDEFDLASEMAARVGCEIQPVRVSQRQLIEQLADAVYFSEGLAVNGHLPAKYILHREIQKAGYKVALTGEGSDELVAGYPHLRIDLFRSAGQDGLTDALYASNPASVGIMLKHGESLPLTAVHKKLDFVPSFLEAKGTLGYKICSILSDDFKVGFSNRDCYEELLDSFNVEGQLRGRSPVYQSLDLWSKTALANYILKTLGDGTEMAHAVEGRVPFLDHHLFEFVRGLPLSMKIKDSVEKYVLREAVRPLITETIYARRKHPFVAPPVSRFSDPAAEEILQDTLRSEGFGSVPFFDRSKVLQLLDGLASMPSEDRAAVDPVLMTALSTAALHERFKLAGTPA